MAGLWTEVCLLMPVLSAVDDGYEVYFITDASGGATHEAHDNTVQRMIQAGAARSPPRWSRNQTFDIEQAAADYNRNVDSVPRNHREMCERQRQQ